MKRAIAHVYFALLGLHALQWLALLYAPGAPNVEEIGLLALASTPLVFLGALFGVVQPRRPVAAITALVLITAVIEMSRIDGGRREPSTGETAAAVITLLLAIAGQVVVTRYGGGRTLE